jgi:sulfatase maturation enzyme AslB (radical SAM superfamily)
MKCPAFKGQSANFAPSGKIGLCCNDWAQDTRPDMFITDSTQRADYISQQNYTGFDFCKICLDTEANGNISTRQGLMAYPDNFSLTIFVGNTCNLRCVMCRPEYSSLLSQDISQLPTHLKKYYKINNIKNFVISNNQRNKITEFLKTIAQPITLNIQGGEPLSDIDILEWITDISKTYPLINKININTNLTYNTRRTKTFIQDERVYLNVSIDGSQDSYEWGRFGAKWSQITKNLTDFHMILGERLRVHSVLHAVSALGHKNLIDYLTQKGISQETFQLVDPFFLQINVLNESEQQALGMPFIDCNLPARVLFLDYMASLERSRGKQMPESISKFFNITGK